jgi:hypothetical protein
MRTSTGLEPGGLLRVQCGQFLEGGPALGLGQFGESFDFRGEVVHCSNLISRAALDSTSRGYALAWKSPFGAAQVIAVGHRRTARRMAASDSKAFCGSGCGLGSATYH